MPLIPAKCTNCGGTLEVDAAKEAAVCPHCGSAFITEKAINNYNTYNQTINQIHADTVIVQGESQKEFVVEGGVLTAYKGASMDIIVPDGVRRIGENCFQDMEITSLILPEGVTKIGDGAFNRCHSLRRVELPGTLNSIGRWAFRGCTGLCQPLRLPEGLSVIDVYAFADCNGLKNIAFPSSLQTISEGAFQSCYNLETVSLPEGLQFLGKSAFGSCTGLTSVYIPGTLQTMEGEAFVGCGNLRQINSPVFADVIMDKLKPHNGVTGNFYGVSYVDEARRMLLHKCRHCGGTFHKGMFSKVEKCRDCGREKDY